MVPVPEVINPIEEEVEDISAFEAEMREVSPVQ